MRFRELIPLPHTSLAFCLPSVARLAGFSLMRASSFVTLSLLHASSIDVCVAPIQRRAHACRMGVLLLACALVQSSSALVLTGLRAPTVRAGTDRSCEHRTFGLAGTDRSGVRQLQARLSEEDGGTVCVILDDDDVQQ